MLSANNDSRVCSVSSNCTGRLKARRDGSRGRCSLHLSQRANLKRESNKKEPDNSTSYVCSDPVISCTQYSCVAKFTS